MMERDPAKERHDLPKRTGDVYSVVKILKGLIAVTIALFLIVGLFPTSLFRTSVYAADVDINDANFPDEKFRDFVKTFDKDSDGKLSDAERANATEITINRQGCTSLKGVEHFTELTELDCTHNELTDLDVSKLTELRVLSCGLNKEIKVLDLTNQSKLEQLFCNYIGIDTLNVNHLTSLTNLACVGNGLKELKVDKLVNLKQLSCSNNQLEELDITPLTKLTDFGCSYNNFKSVIDVRHLPDLFKYENAGNKLTKIELNNPKLGTLDLSDNQLTTLDLNQPELFLLDVSENQLTSLDLNHLKKMEYLDVHNNQLEKLEIDQWVSATISDNLLSYNSHER